MGVQRIVNASRALASALLGDLDEAVVAIATLDTPARGSGFELEGVRARAWVEVASGHTDDAIELLLADAEACAERGHVAGAIAHLHDVARLGSADLAIDRMAVLAVDTDSRLIDLQLQHAAALSTDDADELEAAATGFAEIGANLLAAEGFAQAAAVHRRAGRQARSSAAAARSRELVASCEGASTPALAGAEPLVALTRREREIVLLAADGLTDREIADQLVVSVRTVESHLHHAYAKLGIERRDALSAAIAQY
jgi:ATP/maltotriose-dependent transcriptional regulator MalT